MDKNLNKILQLVDANVSNIPEGDYLQICNALKQVHMNTESISVECIDAYHDWLENVKNLRIYREATKEKDDFDIKNDMCDFEMSMCGSTIPFIFVELFQKNIILNPNINKNKKMESIHKYKSNFDFSKDFKLEDLKQYHEILPDVLTGDVKTDLKILSKFNNEKLDENTTLCESLTKEAWEHLHTFGNQTKHLFKLFDETDEHESYITWYENLS